MSESEHFPLLQTSCTDGIVTVHGEVDIATWDLFEAIVDSVVEDGATTHPGAGVHLDLAGVDFIDSGGARVLVTAATERLRGLELIVHHPPIMLVRIVEFFWGQVPNLRFESPQPTGEPTMMRPASLAWGGRRLPMCPSRQDQRGLARRPIRVATANGTIRTPSWERLDGTRRFSGT